MMYVVFPILLSIVPNSQKRYVVTVGFEENLVSWVISFCGKSRGPTQTCLLWQQFFKKLVVSFAQTSSLLVTLCLVYSGSV